MIASRWLHARAADRMSHLFAHMVRHLDEACYEHPEESESNAGH